MGERHGFGVMLYIDGSRYEGAFLLNKRAGPNCTFAFADNHEYRGDFADDRIHGDGVMVSLPHT